MNLWQKTLIWLGGLEQGRQDRENLVTNRVTLVEADDGRAASRGAALGISSTWACVNLLAGTIGSLPLMVYRTVGDERNVAKDHYLYRLLHDRPNYDQTALDFLEFMAASLELHGNAYAEKRITADGRTTSLLPIRPDLVEVTRQKQGSLLYRWTDDGVRNELGQDNVLHIRGFGGGPLGGASTLAVCRQTFLGAMSVEQAATGMFGNGARPSGVLKVERALTLDQRKAAEALLQEKFVGAINQGRPMLLDHGMAWQQLTMNPEDAQMLESRRFSVEEICRVFGVPPHMIGHTENSTSWGTGLEQQTLGFQKFTLRRRLKRIEMALEQQLLNERERQDGVTIEFNLEGLLRGDTASRFGSYQTGLQNGIYTINEVRALENMPPVKGGDVPRMQMQNVPITQAGQVDPATAV